MTDPGPVSTAWLASYVKSGNTWLRLLLNDLEWGEHHDWNGVDGPHDELDPTLGFPLASLSPQEAAAIMRLSWTLAPRGRRVHRRKTHRPWTAAPDGRPACWVPAAVDPGGPGGRVVYIVRDPRAVAVSWAHHSGRSQQQAVLDLATVSPGALPAEQLDTPAWPEVGWSGHVSSWVTQEHLPLLLVRYEDLHARPAEILDQVADFVDLAHTREAIVGAVARCAFGALAAKEALAGFHEASASDRVFFRRGEVDSWRTELDSGLAESIEREHGQVMRQLGYLPSREVQSSAPARGRAGGEGRRRGQGPPAGIV